MQHSDMIISVLIPLLTSLFSYVSCAPSAFALQDLLLGNPRSFISDANQLWLTRNVWSVYAIAFATVFMIGGLGTVVYYYYYLNIRGYSGNAYYTGKPGYSRSGKSESSPSLPLQLISLVQGSIEKLDVQSFECQKYHLCNLAQNKSGEANGTIPSYISNKNISNASNRILKILEGWSIPNIALTFLIDYQEAFDEGVQSESNCTYCTVLYPNCNHTLPGTNIRKKMKY